MMICVYGISHCGSVKKARKLLEEKNIQHSFIDFKTTPPTEAQVTRWLRCVKGGIINKSSATWRGLTPQEKQQADNPQQVVQLILKYPLLIKRPLIEWGESDDNLSVGFDENRLNLRIEQLFQAA